MSKKKKVVIEAIVGLGGAVKQLAEPLSRDKAKEFDAAKLNITPHPTREPEDLMGVGLPGDEPRRRHRRTRAEIEAAKNALPLAPNLAFLPLLETVFQIVAAYTGLPEIRARSKVFAERLCLPVSQLASYYFPQMTPIYAVWANFGIAVTGIGSEIYFIAKLNHEAKNPLNKHTAQGAQGAQAQAAPGAAAGGNTVNSGQGIDAAQLETQKI